MGTSRETLVGASGEEVVTSGGEDGVPRRTGKKKGRKKRVAKQVVRYTDIITYICNDYLP